MTPPALRTPRGLPEAHPVKPISATDKPTRAAAPKTRRWSDRTPNTTRLRVRDRSAVRFVADCGFCDVSEQASHNGDLAHAVEAGLVSRGDVTELGTVLAGEAEGRRSPEEITVFDSTGLAIQDLAVALAALEHAPELDLPTLDL